MGTVIRFPSERRSVEGGAAVTGRRSASIMILPVVRIERICEAPTDDIAPDNSNASGRKRRRRSSSRT